VSSIFGESKEVESGGGETETGGESKSTWINGTWIEGVFCTADVMAH
jgi:hypothetical protein